MTDPESSDSDKSRDDIISLKRPKLSASQGVETALNGRNGHLERSPSVISGYDEFVCSANLSDDSSLSSASISTTAASEYSPRESQPCPMPTWSGRSERLSARSMLMGCRTT